MKSRRDFLKIGSLAVVGGLFLGEGTSVFSQIIKNGDYFPIPTAAYSNQINSFSCNTFEPLIKTVFTIEEKKSAKVSLWLVEVVDENIKAARLSRISGESFSLIFEAENNAPLEDKIYKMTHPQLGEFSLFISTVGRSGKRYQAIFNRVYI